MYRRSYRFIGLLMCYFLPLVIAPASSMEKLQESKTTTIEPQAVQVLKHMTEYLQGLQAFRPGRDRRGRVARLRPENPGRQDCDRVGAASQPVAGRFLGRWGRPATCLRWQDHDSDGPQQKCVQHHRRPPEIDAALNHTIKAYNLRVPLADLIYAKAYDYLMEDACRLLSGAEQGTGATVPSPGFQTKGDRLANLDRKRSNPAAPQVPHHG